MAGENIIEKNPAVNAEDVVVPENISNTAENIEQSAERPRASSKPNLEKMTPPVKSVPATNIIAAGQAQSFQARRAQEIDQILADGLHEVFLSLTPDKQQEFKKKGEETVAKINTLLSQTKTKVSQVINLIKQWLRIIPGINQFFLEQEAKLKADRIIKIKDNF